MGIASPKSWSWPGDDILTESKIKFLDPLDCFGYPCQSIIYNWLRCKIYCDDCTCLCKRWAVHRNLIAFFHVFQTSANYARVFLLRSADHLKSLGSEVPLLGNCLKAFLHKKFEGCHVCIFLWKCLGSRPECDVNPHSGWHVDSGDWWDEWCSN